MLPSSSQYSALIFPDMENVQSGQVASIVSALSHVVYDYHVPIITAGNFLTNDQNGTALPGNSYANMQALLDVTRVGSVRRTIRSPQIPRRLPITIRSSPATRPANSSAAPAVSSLGRRRATTPTRDTRPSTASRSRPRCSRISTFRAEPLSPAWCRRPPAAPTPCSRPRACSATATCCSTPSRTRCSAPRRACR